MLALAPVKNLNSHPYLLSHSTINFSGRKYSTSRLTTEINNSLINLSEKVLADIEKIKPSRIKQEIDVGRNITHLDSKVIFDHAIELSYCESPRIKDKALYLLFKAAEKGSLQAINDLGSLYLNGAPELNQGQDCDQRLGIELLKESAKHGNVDALMNLGFHYLIGKGVEQNINKAMIYYGRADRSGHPSAMGTINFIKFHILTASDPKKTAKFFVENEDFPFITVANNPHE